MGGLVTESPTFLPQFLRGKGHALIKSGSQKSGSGSQKNIQQLITSFSEQILLSL
jgi:hypothetical protein